MPKKESKKYPDDCDTDQDQWVLMLPDSCTKSDGDFNPAFCKLRHPKSESSSIFLFTADNKTIYEAIKLNEKYRSWLIDETVQSDGSICIPTPVDPVFLTLPYLIKASKSGKFMQLDQIIEDSEFPEVNRLCSCKGLDQLKHVCQVKGADDYKVYRYDQDKTLTWLKKKVERLSKVLAEQKIHTSMASSCASSYVKSAKSTGASSDELLRFAHGMVSEYIPASLSTDLQNFIGIKDIVHEKPDIEAPKAKKRKSDITPLEDYSKKNDENIDANKKVSKSSAAQKQLQKVDKSGMKNISSFFSPKPKK